MSGMIFDGYTPESSPCVQNYRIGLSYDPAYLQRSLAQISAIARGYRAEYEVRPLKLPTDASCAPPLICDPTDCALSLYLDWSMHDVLRSDLRCRKTCGRYP
jgi:hypothetical protein